MEEGWRVERSCTRPGARAQGPRVRRAEPPGSGRGALWHSKGGHPGHMYTARARARAVATCGGCSSRAASPYLAWVWRAWLGVVKQVARVRWAGGDASCVRVGWPCTPGVHARWRGEVRGW